MFRTQIDGATLRGRLNDPDWLVVDVRHQLADPAAGERAYAEGHLPGAVFLHLDRDLSGPMTGRNGRHPLPDPQDLVARFSQLGIGEKSQVVVYDDAGGMIASRLWWLLRWLGHDAVALLDGGWPAWLAAGGATSREVPKRSAVRFEIRLRPRLLVELDEVQNNLQRQDFLLLDARSPDRFRGENETLDPVGGHIPGARNRFLKDNLTADGLLKPVAQLRAEYAEVLGGFPPGRVVHQCGSGVSACLNMLAMEHAGLVGSRLYAGSWSEWCADPARPMVLRTA
ncbi:MAG TPA: sulfurtransferase [Rhodocyclaceae bacterium]|nr:sulfurtransferase [Rhodocyclaceae bacterium]